MKNNLKKILVTISLFAICIGAINTIAYSFKQDSPVNREDIKRFRG